jgi:hypothetical protein
MSDNLRFKKNLLETNDPVSQILYQLRMGSAATTTTILSSVVSSMIMGAQHADGEFGFEFDVYDAHGTNDAYLNYLVRYNSAQAVKVLNIITIRDTETNNPKVVLNASHLNVDTFSTGTNIGGGITDISYISSQSISTNNLSSGNAFIGNAGINSLSTGAASVGLLNVSTLAGFSPINVRNAMISNSTIITSTMVTNLINVSSIGVASIGQVGTHTLVTNTGGMLFFGYMSSALKYYSLISNTYNNAYNTSFQDTTASNGTIFPTSSFSTSFTANVLTFSSSNGPIALGNYASFSYIPKNFENITQFIHSPLTFTTGFYLDFNGYKLQTVGDQWVSLYNRSTILYDPASNIIFQSSGYFMSQKATLGIYRTSTFLALYTFENSSFSLFYSTNAASYTNYNFAYSFTPYYVVPFSFLCNVEEYTTSSRNFISTFNQVSVFNTSTMNTTYASISTLNVTGNVAIGSSAPATKFELQNSVAGSAPTGSANTWNESLGFSGTGRAWSMGIETTNAAAYSLGFFNYSNSTISGTRYIRGYLLGATAGSNKQMNFTGQHRCVVKDESMSTLQSKIGFIVCSDNNTYIDMYSGSTIRGKGAITIDEALPVVSIANKENDKSCFGVISMTEDPDSRTYDAGTFVTPYSKELGDTRTFVNALGEGGIWVLNKNGVLEAGDYITSSRVPGYGQKQADDVIHNYTVAKITMDCDFKAPIQSTYEILKSSYEFSTQFTSSVIENVSTYVSSLSTMYVMQSTMQSTFNSSFYSSMNVLDSNGNMIWIPAIDSNGVPIMETAYNIRYVNEYGAILSDNEYNMYISTLSTAYIAAFVGCTYHCG